MAKIIDLGERFFLLANRVLSNGSQETLGNKNGITNNTATDQSLPTTKAVKEYVDSKIYNHPTHTAYTGQPTEDQTPGFGEKANVSQFKVDSLGHVIEKNDRTIKIPGTIVTTTKNGLMSKTDKGKLDGIPADANHYDHPTYTARTGQPTEDQTPDFGGSVPVSQIITDSSGHVTAATTRSIQIPSTKAQPIIKNSNGTVTSQGKDGLMSIADKTKLDQIKSLEWTEVALKTGGNDWLQSGSFNKENARISYNDYIAILELNFNSDYVNQHSQINLAAQYWWELGELPDGVPKPLAPVGTINTYGYVKRSYIKITKGGSVELWSPERIDKLGIEGTLMWRVSQ